MILGMSTHVFTLFHVVTSLVAIASGLIVIAGLMANNLQRRWNSLFWVTASLTSLTGFAFPNAHITPGIIVGFLCCIALLLATVALYVRHLKAGQRRIFVVSTAVALYFNVFVLVAQLFQHVPFLATLDRTGSGSIFAVAQLLVVAVFTLVALTADKRFAAEAPSISTRGAQPSASVRWER